MTEISLAEKRLNGGGMVMAEVRGDDEVGNRLTDVK